ncbi:MAG: hypothetical protein EZS28_005532 [Streblomastix strix]|uniref:Doublecortin domain-containing protein n=1 Tax=Streblomastix strix TaxID=222440 RepID=A0A5J4WWS6_9EUKA|nr:MAG: hypothetical protein EZS28_005532 [Streblomastix strix]
MTNPIKIVVFRNGDLHHKGTRIIIKPHIHEMQQLYEVINKECPLVVGACRRLLTIDGEQVSEIQDLIDGNRYFALGGEQLNLNKMPYVLQQKDKQDYADDLIFPEFYQDEIEYMPIFSTPKRPLKMFGVQTEKAKVIFVFRNGDIYDKGARITLKSSVTSMEKLYKLVTSECQLVTGSCRKLVTPTGDIINSLQEFEDYSNLIACAGEPLNLTRLPIILRKKIKKEKPEQEEEQSPIEQQRPSSNSPTPKRPLKMFGVQTEKAKVIFVFRNGDIYDKGTRITLKASVTTMQKLYLLVSNECKLVTGSCRKLVTPQGKSINSLQEFEDYSNLIACAGEPLNLTRLPIVLRKKN